MNDGDLADVLEEAGQSVHPAELGPRLKQMVEEEAARAESETPDEEPEPTPEEGGAEAPALPQAPEEEEPEPSEVEDEPHPLEGLRERYAELLAEYELPDSIAPCPVCQGSPIPGALPFSLAQDPTTRTCRVCGGFGEVITGSLVSQEGSRMCRTCNGRGYEDLVEGTAPPLPLTPEEPGELGYVPIQVPTAPPVPPLASTG